MLDKRLGINLTETTRPEPCADLVPHDCFKHLFVFNNMPKDKHYRRLVRSVLSQLTAMLLRNGVASFETLSRLIL